MIRYDGASRAGLTSSRDYVDHLSLARALGRTDGLITAVTDAPPASSA